MQVGCWQSTAGAVPAVLHTNRFPPVQSLAGEERRLQSTASQLERELATREGQLAGQAGEMAALQEALRTAQAQSNQYVMDLQVGLGCLLACWLCVPPLEVASVATRDGCCASPEVVVGPLTRC